MPGNPSTAAEAAVAGLCEMNELELVLADRLDAGGGVACGCSQ